MTYPPKEIYKTILFLASKTEAFHLTLSKFCQQISAVPEAVLAPEYKVMQALRFTLDVRQPFRGLKGTLMELLNMADEDFQGLKALKEPKGRGASAWKFPGEGRVVEKKHVVDRINQAYHIARGILDVEASGTDVYFLYTPSQILLAALQLADEPLLLYYLDSKLPSDAEIRPRILSTIRECADIMASFRAEDIISKEERVALEAKLEGCRDPSTRDMVGSHAAMKKNGGVGEEEGDSSEREEARRRKMEKQKVKREADDMFGPAIGKG